MGGEALAGQVALVTGAARRLGRAVTRALSGRGAGVVIHYGGSRAEAEALAEELRGKQQEAWTVQADLADPEQAESLAARAIEAAGRLDILVNNASIFEPDTLAKVRFEEVMKNAAVNAWAPFVLSRSFAERVERGGIVNFLDTRILGGDERHVSYILSKHLLAVLTRMTALAFAPKVRVNAVAPGLILPPPGEDESYLERLAERVPLKRHGGERDIVEAVLYLVQAEFVTGQVLFVDGGRHVMEQSGGSHSH